jgi:O-antigen/teichoic acid export membrane protein
MGWAQWHYSWLRSGRHQQMVARGANYYFLAAGFLAVLVSAWILPLFHLIMPERYWDASRAVAPLALAGIATGAYTLFAVGLNVTKRMRLLPPLALVGAAVAVGLYFLLIPPYSFVGAGWATAAALWVLALLVLAVSNRIYPVPWDWRRIALAVGLTGGLCLAALALDAWVDTTISIPARLGITAAYPLALLAAGFLPPGDLAAARAALRRG